MQTKEMIQKFYSLENGSVENMERKKLKRQSTISSEASMDMSDISQNSLLCGMKEFDKAVQNMEETILVPSRLMDMSVTDESDKVKQRVPALLQHSEAYDVYQLVKSVRSQVRRGAVDLDDDAPCRDETLQGGLIRRPSTLSSQSLCSLASESGDSGAEASSSDGEPVEERCERVKAEFSAHLSGLAKCLAQMTDAATYLSGRYEQALNQ